MNDQNQSGESELVDVVDVNDIFVEKRPLADCLRLGLLHRAVTVFLRNSKGEIFLQQRSKSDDWLPGLWTASCTGHVKSGEDPASAAKREMKEELGIACEPVFQFRFFAPNIKSGERSEREIDIVYEAISDDSPELDTKELEDGQFLSLDDCKRFFQNNRERISPDAVIAFERYLSRSKI